MFQHLVVGCDGCNCDVHGTVESANLACNKQTGKCPCKTLAVGLKCDSCLTGFFYGLDKYHPTGCLKCQCSGKTVNCSSKANMYESSVKTIPNPLTNNGSLNGWTTTGGINLTPIWAFPNGVPRYRSYNIL